MLSENGQQTKNSGQMAVVAVNITEDDLFSFHQVHFGGQAVNQFGHEFLRPTESAVEAHDGDDNRWDDDDDDGLGYYEDGVKRTLTEQQIAIFRHSELLEMKRRLEKEDATADGMPTELMGDGSASSPGLNISALSTNSRVGKKKKKKKGKGRLPPEPKPDLRKRTWDIVEKGLDSLDYD